MKTNPLLFIAFLFIAFFSCDSEEDNQPRVTSIYLVSDSANVQVGTTINFTVTTNLEQVVTSASSIYIDDVLVNSSFVPTLPGEYVAKAVYTNNNESFESNSIIIVVTEIPLTQITLNSDTVDGEVGQPFTFTVTGDNLTDLTGVATYYINDSPIGSNVFTPNQTGTFMAKAEHVVNGTTYASNTLELHVLSESTETTFFDEIVFYDGYAATVNEPVPAGIIRVSNASYVTEITDESIAKINDELEIEVVIGALCDNYDRIGGVFLNLVNEGDPYTPSNVVERIEMGRFITPFMNKNVQPDEVPYSFQVDNIAKLLNDPIMNTDYDFFLEFNVFGVPYAANNEVAGCSGRNDVFRGTVVFKSRNESYTPANQYLKAIATDFIFNDYQAGASDAIGQSIKTFNFNTTESITNAQVHVVISNHGANSGGEEYIRRQHYLYFDSTLVSSYIPGGESCEPYRIYNTQSNGIYGPVPRSDSEWASFSNWCPGNVIPIRTYDLGTVSSGTHSFVLNVPDAVFNGDQGHFPVSVYLQGDL